MAGIFTIIALLLVAGLFAWAAHSGVQKVEKTRKHSMRSSSVVAAAVFDISETTKEVDFQRDVMPIFEASCIGCHGPRKQRAGFRVDQREGFFAAEDGGAIVVAGHSAKSRLMAIVSGKVDDMKSAEDHILPAAEVAVLKAWIDAGAVWREK